MNYYAKLNNAIAENQSLLVVGLDPNPEIWLRLASLAITTNREKLYQFKLCSQQIRHPR